MPSARTLTIGYTPDSDDAFYYVALEKNLVRLPGFRLNFLRAPMATLNRLALEGAYEVTAISSVLYPRVADRYAILSVGTNVGRGYGPILVSKRLREPADLCGRRVGVAGIPTTGWFLLRWLCPTAIPVEMSFDQIGQAVTEGELDAGVMIHEELLYYPNLGLQCVRDLGAAWRARHGLPLPVGLNIVRRDLGRPHMERVCAAIRRSLRHGLRHPEDTLRAVSHLGRGPEGNCTSQFVSMFANEDSLRIRSDVRCGLTTLLAQVAELGVGPVVRRLDIVKGIRVSASHGYK
jgi:1,4-dihydroxy-6-naphthoate synthase